MDAIELLVSLPGPRGITDACHVCGARSWLNSRDRDAHVLACEQIEEGLKYDQSVADLEAEIAAIGGSVVHEIDGNSIDVDPVGRDEDADTDTDTGAGADTSGIEKDT